VGVVREPQLHRHAVEAAEGLLPVGQPWQRLIRYVNLERGLVAGFAASSLGLFLLGVALWQWREAGFGRLDYARTMRVVIPGVTLAALGFQTVLSSFFLSILRLAKR
jgi:hypothetical protein